MFETERQREMMQSLQVRVRWLAPGHRLVRRAYPLPSFDFIAIWTILSGQIGFNYAEKESGILGPGDGYLLSPWTPLSLNIQSNGRPLVRGFHLDATVLGGQPLFSLIQHPATFRPDTARRLSKHLDRMFEATTNPSQSLGHIPVVQQSALGCLQVILEASSLLDHQFTLVQDRKRLEPALQLLGNPIIPPLAVPDLAKACSLSPATFHRLFRRVFAQSPSRYQQVRRIEAVRAELAQGNDTLEALAQTYGFADAFHLSRQFKAIFGMNPRQYRHEVIRTFSR